MDRIFPRGHPRQKRAFLNVFGTIGKVLFGWVDNEDEKMDELQEG